jgi:hypothetical protein
MNGSLRLLAIASGIVAVLATGVPALAASAALARTADSHAVSDRGTAAIRQVSDAACRDVRYNGWKRVADASASGGAYCMSHVAGNGITFNFNASTVRWVAHRGPNQGRAKVYIDGYSKGKVDLYAPTSGRLVETYPNLGSGTHALQLFVVGTKNDASTATNVSVDAFIAGATTSQETSCQIEFGSWRCASANGARGGFVHVSSWAGAEVSMPFTGSSVALITRTGPNYGKARVSIDGVSKGTIDLYAPVGHTNVSKAFGGLGAGSHTILVEVLHKRNLDAHGFAIDIDGFDVPAGNP